MFHFLFKEREKQLQEQEKIDNQLNEMKKTCPSLVADYLLIQRTITRNQQFKLMNSELLSLKRNLEREMQVHQTIHSTFNKKINSTYDKCKNLKSIVKEINHNE